MSTLELKELSHPSGEVIKIASGKTLDLKSQGTTTLPTGSVLQVVSYQALSAQTTTSTSWADTNLSLSITPSSTSSKIHIQLSIFVYLSAATAGASFRIMRDSTSLHTPTVGHQVYAEGINEIYMKFGDIALDSPSTTSAVTYKVQVRSQNHNSVAVGDARFPNTITLMEVSA